MEKIKKLRISKLAALAVEYGSDRVKLR